MNKKYWYAVGASFDQGLIIDEETGKNVAVSYDKKDAPVLAAGKEAVELLAETLDILNNTEGSDSKLRDKIAEFLDRVNNGYRL